MKTVRCSICRQHLPTLETLIHHYLNCHSKIRLIRELLKCNILQATPSVMKKKNHKKRRICRQVVRQFQSKTIYLQNDVQILCGRNEIIIGDEKSIDLKFSFDDTCDSKENICLPFKDKVHKAVPKKKVKLNADSKTSKCKKNMDEDKKPSTKRNLKRKSHILENMYYQINITKIKDFDTIDKSLDDSTGEFYVCHCMNSLLPRLLGESDELAKKVAPNKFCPTCGFECTSDLQLLEHLKVHEAAYCNICRTVLSSPQQLHNHFQSHMFKVYVCHLCHVEFPFKQMLSTHFEYHMEDDLFDMVLDLEDDYQLHRVPFNHMTYNDSINSILCFLNESHDPHYYQYKYMKTSCDICCQEILLCDYEHHLQNVHYIYSY